MDAKMIKEALNDGTLTEDDIRNNPRSILELLNDKIKWKFKAVKSDDGKYHLTSLDGSFLTAPPDELVKLSKAMHSAFTKGDATIAFNLLADMNLSAGMANLFMNLARDSFKLHLERNDMRELTSLLDALADIQDKKEKVHSPYPEQ
jgi:hypothetical protein